MPLIFFLPGVSIIVPPLEIVIPEYIGAFKGLLFSVTRDQRRGEDKRLHCFVVNHQSGEQRSQAGV